MIDGNSFRAVCQQDGMPDEGTLYTWIAEHDEFRQIYARARELQAMQWAEEVLSIADDARLDPHDRRIWVDTRKWLLSKVLPRVYGDKVTVAGATLVRIGPSGEVGTVKPDMPLPWRWRSPCTAVWPRSRPSAAARVTACTSAGRMLVLGIML